MSWPRNGSSSCEFFAWLRENHASPLGALEAYGECFAQMAESPETLAHHLSYLQLDFTDPDFRRHARDRARVVDTAILELLEEALAVGELAPGTELIALLRAVTAVLGGSLLAWGMRQEGSAAEWLRADLNAVLAPVRAVAPD